MSTLQRCRTIIAAIVVLAVSIAAGPRDALSRARELYNKEEYDRSIQAAREALGASETMNGASLVLARAYLERFRRTGDSSDLPSAREMLKRVRADELPADDRIELAIALGESLYFDDQPGAAAEQFELALARADQQIPGRRERVLDWWAGALDRQARMGNAADARAIYARLVRRMEDELRRDPASPVASYWLVAGARGAGDLERAWNAAIAAWVRAPRGGAGAGLRNDLDRIVLQAIIPERAREMSQNAAAATAASLRNDWERFKQAWAER
jgi:hypothetical protein